MTGLVRNAALLSVCGLLAAGAVSAGIPDATNSLLLRDTPVLSETNFFVPVSYQAGAVVASGTVATGRAGVFKRRVRVKDFAGNAISGALVKISFSDCCDIVLCPTASQAVGGTGASADFATHVVSGFTNASGDFVFTIVGGAQNDKPNNLASSNRGGCEFWTGLGVLNPTAKTVKIYANVGTGDILIKQATGIVMNTDASIAGGSLFTAGDASRVIQDFLTTGGATFKPGRDNIDQNTLLTANDAGFNFQEFLFGLVSSGSSCGAGGALEVRTGPTLGSVQPAGCP